MKAPTFASLVLFAQLVPADAQSYYVDFTDPGWSNDSTGGSSEFQTNGSGRGNDAGWKATHSIDSIDGSGVGATLSINHQVNAWNIENRPALAPYFPSDYGADGDILRSWNNPANLKSGQIPAFSLVFTMPVALGQFGLEGFRNDDAWRVTAFDAEGNTVAPNWENPNEVTITAPGSRPGDTAINILSSTGVNGAVGAETLGAGRYDEESMSFIVWNAHEVFERGAAIIDYNGAEVSRMLYEMIEVDTRTGEFVGTPADQSMYVGSGITFGPAPSTIPEPSSLLLALPGMLLMLRRKRD